MLLVSYYFLVYRERHGWLAEKWFLSLENPIKVDLCLHLPESQNLLHTPSSLGFSVSLHPKMLLLVPTPTMVSLLNKYSWDLYQVLTKYRCRIYLITITAEHSYKQQFVPFNSSDRKWLWPLDHNALMMAEGHRHGTRFAPSIYTLNTSIPLHPDLVRQALVHLSR